MTQKQSRQLLWLTLAFIGLLILIIIGANRGTELFAPFYDVPYADKVGHFVLIGTLSFLVNAYWRGRSFRLGPLTILWGSFIVLLVVTAEELSQLFLIYRKFDLLDLAADYAGILFFGWLARRALNRHGD